MIFVTEVFTQSVCAFVPAADVKAMAASGLILIFCVLVSAQLPFVTMYDIGIAPFNEEGLKVFPVTPVPDHVPPV